MEISQGVEAYDFEVTGEKVAAVRTNSGSITADKVVIACGAWSQNIAARLGFNLPIKPIRGQIVLLNCGQPILSRLVNAGRRYLVSRDDGRVLVGSTQEDVGFDRRNTAEAVSDFLQFATRLVPQLQAADMERCWTGFRPRGVDDLPYLGPAPGLENVFLATGHFRAGLAIHRHRRSDQPLDSRRSARRRSHAVSRRAAGADNQPANRRAESRSLTLFRRDGDQFFRHRFQLFRPDARSLFGKAHQQRQIAQPVDLPRQPVR